MLTRFEYGLITIRIMSLPGAPSGRYSAMIGAMFWTIHDDHEWNFAFSNVMRPQLRGYPTTSVQTGERPRR